MKKSILPVLALGAFLAGNAIAATPAEARMGCSADCPAYAGVVSDFTPEQEARLDTLVQEHIAVVQPLRTQLDEKMLELKMLSPNPNTKPETISALTKEVSGLRNQLDQENASFRAKLEKEGLPSFGGMGMGQRGMGRGSMGGHNGGHNGGHW